MQSYFLYGLRDVETVRRTLARFLSQPEWTDEWPVGTAETPDAWLRIEPGPEPWYDNASIESGAVIVADVSSVRAPASHTATLEFLRSIQGVLGGVIRDDDDVQVI